MVEAGLSCPGFNEAQKADILDMTNQNYAYRGVSQCATAWPFETLSKPAGVGDQDLDQWLNLLKAGAQSAMHQGLVLGAGEHVKVNFDQNGHFFIDISEEGAKLSFADLARKETILMRMMLLHGWEYYLQRRLTSKEEDEKFVLESNPPTPTEKKMEELGVYELGIDRADAPVNGGTHDTTQDASNATGKVTDAQGGHVSARPFHSQDETIQFEDPFHTRAKSIASDSGFSGMHRGMEMSKVSKELNDLEMQAHEMANTSETARLVEKSRPNYSNALSHALLNTELANVPARGRSGSSAIPIKSPDGKELDFSNKVMTPGNSAKRYASPEKDGRAFDPFNTPSRRGSTTSSGSSGNVSPRTRTTSPKKSYTIKASPTLPPALAPIGTPSRRSMQDNTVKIGATINEEAEDDSIMMGGRRGRGSSYSYY